MTNVYDTLKENEHYSTTVAITPLEAEAELNKSPPWAGDRLMNAFKRLFEPESYKPCQTNLESLTIQYTGTKEDNND